MPMKNVHSRKLRHILYTIFYTNILFLTSSVLANKNCSVTCIAWWNHQIPSSKSCPFLCRMYVQNRLNKDLPSVVTIARNFRDENFLFVINIKIWFLSFFLWITSHYWNSYPNSQIFFNYLDNIISMKRWKTSCWHRP